MVSGFEVGLPDGSAHYVLGLQGVRSLLPWMTRPRLRQALRPGVRRAAYWKEVRFVRRSTVAADVHRRSRVQHELGVLWGRTNRLRAQLSQVDDRLMRTCDHRWVPDRDQYEPCGPTPKICERCGCSN